MGKRGPKRKPGPREPNGRLQRKRKGRAARALAENAVLTHTWLRRGATIGPDGKLVGVDRARRPEAGYVIGRLFLAGVITRRQHEAAMRFAAAWRRWAALAGLPPHILTQREPKVREDVRPAAWGKAKAAYMAAVAAVQECGAPVPVFRFVEFLLMDDAVPPALGEDYAYRPWPAAASVPLRSALDRLADLYGLPLDMDR